MIKNKPILINEEMITKSDLISCATFCTNNSLAKEFSDEEQTKLVDLLKKCSSDDKFDDNKWCKDNHKLCEKVFKTIFRNESLLIQNNSLKEIKKRILKTLQDDFETEDLIDTLQRLQAEFENYKKRVEKQHNDLCKFANRNLIAQLLPLLDSFEIALKNTKNHQDFVKGIELVFSQFVALLENEGLKQIQTENQRFNPCFHEALMQEKHEELDDDLILEEFQKGYMLNDVVIRPSKVKVNKR